MTEPATPSPPATVPAPSLPTLPLAARLAYWGYDAVGGLAALLAVPAWPWLRQRGLGEGIEERLGRVPASSAALAVPPIWLHCASVGEALSATPLVARLRERCPQRPLVISTTTVTGRAVARDQLHADVATLLPIDALHIVDRVFRRVRPRALLVVETEIWPGLFRAATRVGAPIAVVSGRVSARTVERGRWAGPLMPAALAQVAVFGMQTVGDAERIVALGAPAARVHVTGSLKAARVPPTAEAPPLAGLAARRVLVAASTQPGEEEFVLQAFAPLRRVYRDALLLLAPRRPERFDDVAGLLDAARLRWVRRTAAGDAVAPDVDVVLLDTVGELARFFSAAWVVFVGGTVAPLGGHNVLEPAAHGRAVAFGPHTDNVAAAAEALCAAGAAEVVRTPGALVEYCDGLLARREAAEAAGERARAVALSRAESLERTWELVAPLLGAT